MKKAMKIVLSNWFLLSVGLLLTAKCVEAAYQERGYIAFGGEWLVIPLLFLSRELFLEIREGIADDELPRD